MNQSGHTSLALFLVVFVITVAGQMAAGMTADEVFKAASAKYEEFTRSVKDMTVEQEMVMVQGQMKMQMKVMRRGNRYRIETTTSTPPGRGGAQMPPMTTIIIFDGKDTWMVSPFAGKRRLEGEEAKDHSPQISWTEKLKGRLVLLRKERVAGRNAWVIEVKEDKKATGPEAFSKVWIDTGNYWMLKAQSKTPKGTAESRLSDFRKVHGDFSMPFLHEVFINGALQSKLVTRSVKTNTGLSDDLFDASKLKSQGMSLEDMFKQGMQGN